VVALDTVWARGVIGDQVSEGYNSSSSAVRADAFVPVHIDNEEPRQSAFSASSCEQMSAMHVRGAPTLQKFSHRAGTAGMH